jgi:hypothetical protein
MSLIIKRAKFKTKKNLPQKKKNISIQGGGDLSFCGELSFTLSFLFFISAFTVAAANIFTAPTCKPTIISLEPCALNAGDFPHFIPRSNQKFLTGWIPMMKEGLWG